MPHSSAHSTRVRERSAVGPDRRKQEGGKGMTCPVSGLLIGRALLRYRLVDSSSIFVALALFPCPMYSFVAGTYTGKHVSTRVGHESKVASRVSSLPTRRLLPTRVFATPPVRPSLKVQVHHAPVCHCGWKKGSETPGFQPLQACLNSNFFQLFVILGVAVRTTVTGTVGVM